MIYASILAAGITDKNEKRKLPQPYNFLGKKPIIIHTLEQFAISPLIDRIIVVANSDWVVYTEELIKNSIAVPKEIYVISGGDNKNHSIALAAGFIEKKWGITDGDILLNHDAIRPFISQRIIDDNVSNAKKHSAVNTVMPTVDTIIISENKENVDSIPPKSKMYSEQTPQTFNLKKLMNEYAVSDADIFEKENDAARFMLHRGHEVHLVNGDYSNIKIVTAFDIEVANAFIRRSGNDK
ncbi:MAG: D-ribitol-5-phosphate cytidylyltransferase [Huintestinicola sp.]